MINKLKIGLFTAVGVLALASTALAAGITYSISTPVNVASRPYIITAGSTALSVVIGGAGNTTLVVDTTGFGPFTLQSAGGDTLAPSGGLTTSCSNGVSSVIVPAGHAAVTFTPTSVVACVSTAAQGGGGTTSGGGGSSSSSSSSTSTVAQSTTPVTLSISPTVTMTTTSTGCSGGNKYNTSTGALCTNNTNIPGCGDRTSGFSTATGASCVGNSVSSVNVTTTNSNGTTTTTTYNFGTVTLKNGSKGEGVKELQRFLNRFLNLGLVVDGKLGPKTIAVIKKWQKEKGLVADGLIGPKTKAMMNTEAESN